MGRGDARVIPVALTIAGSDSGGGAGIQADLKTFAALGVYGTCAITAITAQNTLGVRARPCGRRQRSSPRRSRPCARISTSRRSRSGCWRRAEIVAAVAAALRRRAGVVYDPVMVASSGDALAGAGFVAAAQRLLPSVELLTPNLAEARALLDAPQAASEAEMVAQGRALLALGRARGADEGRPSRGRGGGSAGHAERRRAASPRRASSRENLHGTGCVLSSAIAAHIAWGAISSTRSAEAKAFTRRAIENGRELALGHGPGPLMPRALKRGREKWPIADFYAALPVIEDFAGAVSPRPIGRCPTIGASASPT